MSPILSQVRVIFNLREGRMEEDQGTGAGLTWVCRFSWFNVVFRGVSHFCLMVRLMRAARLRIGRRQGELKCAKDYIGSIIALNDETILWLYSPAFRICEQM